MSLPPPTGPTYRIGIVCLGNICRSPTADVVLRKLLADAGLADEVEVSSSGTGDWHVGGPMDERAAAQLTSAGYDASAHRAQQFGPDWLDRDLLLAMDAKNLADIGGATDRVRMFRSFDPELPPGATATQLDVPDPYGGGEDGFVDVLQIVERTCRQLVRELEELLG